MHLKVPSMLRSKIELIRRNLIVIEILSVNNSVSALVRDVNVWLLSNKYLWSSLKTTSIFVVVWVKCASVSKYGRKHCKLLLLP